MKKLLLFIALLTISTLGNSQTYLLQEFFNDSINFPPPSWTMIDADGDGYNWRVNTWTNDTSGVIEVYAVSDSWLGGGVGALHPENYLISPQIDLTGLADYSVSVRYTVQAADDPYYAETYKLALSTTGNQVADFTRILFMETLTINEYYVWKGRTIDLTPFVGQKIYLTWCHFDCTDQYKLLLDSIQVSKSPIPGMIEHPALNVMVYPNPASSKLVVTGDYKDARMVLCSADGRIVYSAENQSQQASINVSSFDRGIYILRIETSKGIITRKVTLTD